MKWLYIFHLIQSFQQSNEESICSLEINKLREFNHLSKVIIYPLVNGEGGIQVRSHLLGAWEVETPGCIA